MVWCRPGVVGRADDGMPIHCEDARDLLEEDVGLAQMFDGLEADHQIRTAIGKRQTRRIAGHEPDVVVDRMAAGGVVDGPGISIDTNDVGSAAALGEESAAVAGATRDVDDAHATSTAQSKLIPAHVKLGAPSGEHGERGIVPLHAVGHEPLGIGSGNIESLNQCALDVFGGVGCVTNGVDAGDVDASLPEAAYGVLIDRAFVPVG